MVPQGRKVHQKGYTWVWWVCTWGWLGRTGQLVCTWGWLEHTAVGFGHGETAGAVAGFEHTGQLVCTLGLLGHTAVDAADAVVVVDELEHIEHGDHTEGVAV